MKIYEGECLIRAVNPNDLSIGHYMDYNGDHVFHWAPWQKPPAPMHLNIDYNVWNNDRDKIKIFTK